MLITWVPQRFCRSSRKRLDFHPGAAARKATALKFNIDTKNDGPWKWYLKNQESNMAILDTYRKMFNQIFQHIPGTCPRTSIRFMKEFF